MLIIAARVALGLGAFGCIFASLQCRGLEIDAVNQHLPPNEVIPLNDWRAHWDGDHRLREAYQRLYPDGTLDRRRRVFEIGGGICAVLLLAILFPWITKIR